MMDFDAICAALRERLGPDAKDLPLDNAALEWWPRRPAWA